MPKRARAVPASVAGGCLRYAVMEVLGFGRLLEPQTRQAMAEGSVGHRRFQGELAEAALLVTAEAPLKAADGAVRGRIDAVIRWRGDPAAVEFKTLHDAAFDVVLNGGPRYRHVAQLATYLEFGAFPRGLLVVEGRPSQRRVSFCLSRNAELGRWLKARIEATLRWAAEHRLPSREVSSHCLDCDRWRRCFKDEAERDQAVAQHPRWEPEPPLPPIWVRRMELSPGTAGLCEWAARAERQGGEADAGGSRVLGSDGF